MAMVGESNGNFTGSGMNGDDGNNSAVAKVATTDAILGWIGRCFSSDEKMSVPATPVQRKGGWGWQELERVLAALVKAEGVLETTQQWFACWCKQLGLLPSPMSICALQLMQQRGARPQPSVVDNDQISL
ncbi:hypothetical protein F443_13489 [Phytophthora nicotianae P1569]|uniref:Uncharacterized protein n=1 Tax=Phytophthora nicotianae P1569 TaxID=1317065 RepID=V9EPS5_PHYNI|nr:hypothetical protein F443_13489 [Phytophthora nicotianae P1569]